MDQRERRVLDFLREYIGKSGYAPSYREIMEGATLPSTSSVSRSLLRLKAQGYIVFKPGFPRTLRILDITADEEASADI